MRIQELTKDEIKLLKDRCAFTPEQEKIFDLIALNQYTDFAIRHKLYMSNSRFYEIKKIIKEKIQRLYGDCLVYNRVYLKYA